MFATKVERTKAKKNHDLFLRNEIFLAAIGLRLPSKNVRQLFGSRESETAEGRKNSRFFPKKGKFLCGWGRLATSAVIRQGVPLPSRGEGREKKEKHKKQTVKKTAFQKYF